MHTRLFLLLLLSFSVVPLRAESKPAFDGSTLSGWECPAAEAHWWRVQDGAITGGSLEESTTSNLFLATTAEHRNFEMHLKLRIVKGESFMNSGIQVRSIREGDGGAMKGYQVDAGIGYWGDLYDEHRREKKIAGAIDQKAVDAAVKSWDWNDYRILCEGRRIRSWINGVPALDYTEQDTDIPLDGKIAVQVHAGGKCLVQMKEVLIEDLPDTPGAASWKPGPPSFPAPDPAGAVILSPEQEQATFHLPEGFVAELVASEAQGVGKPITMAWDAKGRMWTMTAFEYPLDGNESPAAAAALYARGGRDKVLIFDDPSAPLPLTPRPFIEGLAIPLGLLPDLDGKGTLVHYGSQIRHYVDSNNDGKADRYDVVLDGFGTQDSHLMPHQFERAPGGWIYVAQGLFNSSMVHRPEMMPFKDGSTQKPLEACKLARFKPDGSAFEALTAGPNNIWGLVQSRRGETWIQEANDMGIPVTEFLPGAFYTTGSADRLRPYAPQMPSSLTTQMGGTGLSGLALADDVGSAFASHYGGDQVFYLANPITNRIQVITTRRAENRHPEYYKREDFMVSSDPCFRPVSIHFGPDGFLYVADWCNKIISHNEVPRNHPDRDKTHGRIWRIRPVDQKPQKPVDLIAMDGETLVKHFDDPNARIAATAVARVGELPQNGGQFFKLQDIIINPKESVERRAAALWAVEGQGLDLTAPGMGHWLSIDPSPELRYEAVRAGGDGRFDLTIFSGLFHSLAYDQNYRVRAGLANSGRNFYPSNEKIMAALVPLGRPPLGPESGWDGYDRDFERYLTRWAMESHPKETEEMLKGRGVGFPDQEALLLAIQSLPPERAAVMMVAELPKLTRALTSEELAILGGQLNQPEVLAGFEAILDDPALRKLVLQNLTRLNASKLSNPALSKLVVEACRALLAEEGDKANRPLVVELAKRFRLAALEEIIAGWAGSDDASECAAGLSALHEMKSGRIELFEKMCDRPEEAVRREAISALAAVDDPKVISLIAARWDKLPGALRTLAVNGLTSSRAKTAAFAIAAGQDSFRDLEGGALERLLLILGESDPAASGLLKKYDGLLSKVIRLSGDSAGAVLLHADLKGPFTVESWIRLDPGIDNSDNLLGHHGGADFNFYDSRFRVFGASGDLIVANRAMTPEIWTHLALTRDETGNFRVYLDGELDQDHGRASMEDFTDLNIGETNPGKGCGACYDEFRIWDVARTPEEIRSAFHTRYTGTTPPHLVKRVAADQPITLRGKAAVERQQEFPILITPEQAAAYEAKFARFHGVATRKGDAAQGKAVFQATCMICHQVRGEGAHIGPDLSGAGAMGLESLLRNVLDPNAQLESGYYRHDVTLATGETVSGFLVSETSDVLTIRPIGAEPRAFSKNTVTSHHISKRSLMPEGLLDGMSEEQVTDLFTYLSGLK